uniref:Uncharacterized protein n=1 Tax=Timema poppense TaxID=170557 RepID=A0A7R9DNA6_TIMPO|nr:unnamed protein product [Timema poppensis]
MEDILKNTKQVLSEKEERIEKYQTYIRFTYKQLQDEIRTLQDTIKLIASKFVDDKDPSIVQVVPQKDSCDNGGGHDTLIFDSTVLPNSAGNLLLSPSQGHNIDKRQKRVRPSIPQLEEKPGSGKALTLFLVMSRADYGENIKRVTPFILERAINGAANSNVAKKNKLRDATILIQTTSDIESGNILALKEISLSNASRIQAKVEAHRFLNVCKGVVTCYDFDCVNIEEICEELTPQNVTEVYRKVVKKNGKFALCLVLGVSEMEGGEKSAGDNN